MFVETASTANFALDHVYRGEADDVLTFVRNNEGGFIVTVMQNYYRALADKVCYKT